MMIIDLVSYDSDVSLFKDCDPGLYRSYCVLMCYPGSVVYLSALRGRIRSSNIDLQTFQTARPGHFALCPVVNLQLEYRICNLGRSQCRSVLGLLRETIRSWLACRSA